MAEIPDSPVDIRIAGPGDAELLAMLGRATFLEAFAGQIEQRNLTLFADKRFGAQKQAVELSTAGTVFYIASHQGDAVGYAKLCASNPPACVMADRAIELERLYLYANWQRRGVAGALMRMCLGEAHRRGCTGMWLDVWDQNTRAQQFYRKYRFELAGQRAYVVGEETQRHLLMHRELAVRRATR